MFPLVKLNHVCTPGVEWESRGTRPPTIRRVRQTEGCFCKGKYRFIPHYYQTDLCKTWFWSCHYYAPGSSLTLYWNKCDPLGWYSRLIIMWSQSILLVLSHHSLPSSLYCRSTGLCAILGTPFIHLLISIYLSSWSTYCMPPSLCPFGDRSPECLLPPPCI